MEPDPTMVLFARTLVRECLADPQFQTAIREAVLTVMVEREKVKAEDTAALLVDACERRGAGLFLNLSGQLRCASKARLTPSLSAALLVYERQVVDYLRRHSADGLETNGHAKNGAPK